MKPTKKFKTFGDYIETNMEKSCALLENGYYELIYSDLVISEQGTVAYFNVNDLFRIGDTVGHPLHLKQQIENRLELLFATAPLFEPAKINGVPVAYHATSNALLNSYFLFTVANHSVTWKHKDPAP